MRKIVLAILLGLGLVACTPSAEEYSTTSVQANYNRAENVILRHIGEGLCLNCFNLYRGWDNHKAYAISTKGAFGYARGMSSSKAAQQTALKVCRARAKGASCKLLMVNDSFVWR